MTNLVSTVDRFKASLTAKERALLTIRAELADEAPDPALRRTLPADQAEEFRRFMVLYYVANAELGTIVIFCHREAHTLARLGFLGEILDRATVEASSALNEEAITGKGRLKQGEPVNLPTYLAGLARECRVIYLEQARARWKELRAVEIVLSEICAEFDHEDIVRGDVRAGLTAARELLDCIFEDCGYKRRPEPDAELVDSYREHVKGVIRMFGLEHLE